MRNRLRDIAPQLVGWVFIACTLFLSLRPTGPVGARVVAWRAMARAQSTVRSEWPGLSGVGTRLGSPTSSPGIVEFLDYRCPYCRVFHDSLQAFLDANPTAAIAIRFIPSRLDPVYRRAALAAVCAAEQGSFPAMHARLMADTTWVTTDDWSAMGRSVGLEDIDRWESCTRSQVAADAILQDSVWASRLSVRGTPAFFGQSGVGRLGLLPTDTLFAWIQTP